MPLFEIEAAFARAEKEVGLLLADTAADIAAAEAASPVYARQTKN